MRAAEIVNGLPREELEPAPVSRLDRPEIDTVNLGLDEMAAAAWAAIEERNTPPRIYRYAGALTWLVPDPAGRLGIEVMRQDHVRHHLADVATFIRWTPRGRAAEKKPAFPPIPLAADLLAVPRTSLPTLHRLVHAPVFARDGRLLTTPGFDAASGLYFDPPAGFTLPPVSPAPSTEEIAAARDMLCHDVLVDFPFTSSADLAHTIALLLTTLLRELVPGCVPLFVVSKPTPRTGAGLLMKVITIIQSGVPIAAVTVSRDEDEMRKRLTALLIPAPALILLDNIRDRLDSPALSAILTTSVWEDRLLGQSKTLKVAVRSTFAVTGNNPVLSNELAGRAVLIRLDPKIEDPGSRTGFRHPRLEAWVGEHRGELLWAALTLGQAWIAAGRPLAAVAFGGYEGWASVLGGVLGVAGIEGFLANRPQLFASADEESATIRAFLAAWWGRYADEGVATKALLDLAKDQALDIAAKTEHGQLVRLGRLVASLEDRQYDLGGGLLLAVRRAGREQRAVRWCLSRESSESPTGEPQWEGSRESVSPVSLPPASAYGRAHACKGESAGTDSPDSEDSQEVGL
jgi:putative DNA primase/helicase